MLLIDEIDRADDEFEAFLLELLSDFQVSIPELGTIVAKRGRRGPDVEPDARAARRAKRRCLYHWIDYPTVERELEIVRVRLPGVPEEIAVRVSEAVARLREQDLYKLPGVGETITWARALVALGDAASLRRDARRRAQGPRGRGACARGRILMGLNASVSRAGVAACAPRGARVGIGEVLAAHRALTAVDAASAGTPTSRCARRCARRGDLALFDAAWARLRH